MKDIVEFYNMRGGKERIFDDMNNGFGWGRLPKSLMAENTVFLLITALIRNFYKAIIQRIEVRKFGFKENYRTKTFVFKFISVPAKWVRTSRQYVLNIYTSNYCCPIKFFKPQKKGLFPFAGFSPKWLLLLLPQNISFHGQK